MAGEQRQEWAWRDIFRSIGLAFSFSRLLVGFFGIALMAVADGYVAYFMGQYAEMGMDWMTTFCRYARLCLIGFIFLFTATAIAYSVKGELLDGEGAGAGESLGFATRRLGTILSTPLLFWIYIGLMAGFGFIGFAIGLIPYAGPILVTLGWFLVFIFAVLAGIGFLAFAFSFFLAPPIIAVRQEGALDAVLDTIDLMRGKGAFWVAILALAASVLVGPVFIGKTLDVTYKAAEWTMDTAKEKRFTKTLRCMPREIKPRDSTHFYRARQFWPGGYGGVREREWGRGRRYREFQRPLPNAHITYKIAGWTLGIWVLILAGFSVSFVMGAFVAAATLTYLIVREEEEFLEPAPVQAPVPTTTGPPKVEEKEKSEGEAKEKPEKESKRQAKKKSKRESKKAKKSG